MRTKVIVRKKDGTERLFRDVVENYPQGKVLLVIVQKDHFRFKIPLADIDEVIEEPNSLNHSDG